MKSSQSQVASLCKKYIKSLGIECKVKSDSFSMGDSVHIRIYDQPPGVTKAIESELSKYQYGHFDGMTDYYESSNRRSDIQQTKYLSVSNDHSDELKKAAYSWLRANWHGGESLPDDYNKGQEWGNTLSGEHIPTMVHRLLTGALDGCSVSFWENRKPKAPEAVQVEGVRIEEHTHTKHGFQMFLVIFPRVEREEYERLLSLCREAGGWYSRRWGKTPGGFAFKDRAKAEAFAANANPQPTDPTSPDSPNTPPKGNKHLADKFREAADKLQPAIDDKFRDRLDNTPKRLAQANHARLEGQKLQRTQAVLRTLADRHEAGDVPAVLAGIRSKSDVFELMTSKSTPVNNGYHQYHVETGTPHYQTPEALALWSLLEKPTPEQEKAEKLRRMVQGLQFSSIPGYFPTPAPVIAQMVDLADIRPEHKVREPEAGHGAIADAVRPLCADLIVDEVNYTLSEILAAKGYAVNRGDFLKVEPDPVFDRVLMNPPFEKLQDIDHVRHAYKFLKPDGGRLVAVMSAGVFYNSTRKASEFRDWVAELGGEVYDLPDGAFKESGTGVSAKLLVLNT